MKWIESVEAELIKLAKCESISDAEEILNEMFGETVTQAVLKEIADKKLSAIAFTSVQIQERQPWSK